MSENKRTVLITGCSTGSLGAGLALALHEKGCTVYATARNPDKMEELKSAGIHCLTMDVLSDSSIQECVKQVSALTSGSLDMLINNAGGGHYMPLLDLDMTKAKELFDVNVWAYLAVTRAFFPLLRANASPSKTGRKSYVVNNTSISSVLKTPFHGAYGASKAAMASFNDTMRIEFYPFGVRVIDLKTGSTESNFSDNRTNQLTLPEDSLYKPIEKEVEKVITGEVTEAYAEDRMTWARNAVTDLLQSDPPAQIWRGGMSGTIQLTDAAPLPEKWTDGQFRSLGGLDVLEQRILDGEKEKK